jgi:putative DNA methylase
MSETVKTRKKLIEVALPLEAINIASAREKSIRHGHPSTLHLWWARRPLAAARAVIFSQMVDDPSSYSDELLADAKNRKAATDELERRRKLWSEREALYEKAGREGQTTVPAPGPQPTLEECAADLERERLFVIIRQLVLWENTTNEIVLTAAREEIWKSWRRTCADNKEHPRAKELFNPDKLPAFHDPFAGGGALPLEAQRLGLEAYASDLNPVAVLINKAMIEIPPKFAGRDPVNPESQRQKKQMGKRWSGAQGLAEDVRYYGKWMRDEAEKRIGHLYPKIEVTPEMAKERPDLKQYVGKKLTVIAWLWARTVKSPNPAFADVDVPLASTFMLSTKAGKEVFIEPLIEKRGYRFNVRAGKPKNAKAAEEGTKLGRGANFRCLMSSAPIAGDYIKAEGKAGRIGARIMAVVADGEDGKVYLSPTKAMEVAAARAHPEWRPEVEFFQQALGFRIGNYGFSKWSELFSPRQLVALTTCSDLLREVFKQVKLDGQKAGQSAGEQLEKGGLQNSAYSEAILVYLAFSIDRVADYWTTFGRWQGANQQLSNMFGRQAIPMVWDYPEANPFSGKGGSIDNLFDWTVQSIENIGHWGLGRSTQDDAAVQAISNEKVISTDPPYYDNIGYADLSDFFYVWLRHSLKELFPELFATLVAPKAEELVATPDRHGGREHAEAFFLGGMTKAMHRLAEQSHPSFPVTIYYAFKQSESDGDNGQASTGWETFLDAVIRAGFATTGTWPMRTEMAQRMRGVEANALASSIVLTCRRRVAEAPIATRRDFLAALKAELPLAVLNLQRSNIAPVDLAQSAIGPGMAVYTRYSQVLDAAGKPLSVRDALALINQTLDEVLAEQESDFDADTRWALAWFDHAGFAEGEFGVAETLSKAKNTSIGGLEDAHILVSKAGKVRLLKPNELPANWDPSHDNRLTVWEIVHHLIRVLEATGESGAAELFRKLGAKVETARELPYRLYTICERKKRAQEALSYNALVQSWPEIARLAREGEAVKPVAQQTQLDYQE